MKVVSKEKKPQQANGYTVNRDKCLVAMPCILYKESLCNSLVNRNYLVVSQTAISEPYNKMKERIGVNRQTDRVRRTD